MEPVDDVFLAVLDGAGLQRAHVAAAAGFGEGEAAANLAAGQAGEESLLLLRCAVVGKHVGKDVVGAQGPGERHVTLADFLENHGKGGVVQAHPAEFLRHVDAEQAQFLHLVNEVVGYGIVGVVFCGDRLYFLAHEIAHHADDLGTGFEWSLSNWSLGDGGCLANGGHGGGSWYLACCDNWRSVYPSPKGGATQMYPFPIRPRRLALTTTTPPEPNVLTRSLPGEADPFQLFNAKWVRVRWILPHPYPLCDGSRPWQTTIH